MNQKSAVKFNKKVAKDMRVTLKKPGDLITKAQLGIGRKPTKRTTAILGLI